MNEILENLLFIIFIILISIIGYGYAKGVNQIGDALTKHQIEKYSKEDEK